MSFSTDPLAHDHDGPYTPGFQVISFGVVTEAELDMALERITRILEGWDNSPRHRACEPA